MNNKFDELTKQMAQSVTRRGALKKLGLGLAGIALACVGLANKAEAAPNPCDPSVSCCCKGCKTSVPRQHPNYYACVDICRNAVGCK